MRFDPEATLTGPPLWAGSLLPAQTLSQDKNVSSLAPTQTPPEVRRMYRPQSGRVLVGVCAGLAAHLGVPLAWVRGGFVALTLFGGAAVPAYLMFWVFTPAGYLVDPRTGELQGADDGSLGDRVGRIDPAWRVLIAGVGLLAVGAPLLSGMFGTDLPLTSVLAILAVVAGAVIAWSHLDAEERRHWLGVRGGRRDRSSLARIVAGAALAVSGSVVLATRGSGPTILWDVLIATVAVLAGLALVLAPWGIRFWKRLQDEQATRIRETERADIAAPANPCPRAELSVSVVPVERSVGFCRISRWDVQELTGHEKRAAESDGWSSPADAADGGVRVAGRAEVR